MNCWEFGGKELPCSTSRAACLRQKCAVYEEIIEPSPHLNEPFLLEAERAEKLLREHPLRDRMKTQNLKLWAAIESLLKTLEMFHLPTAQHSRKVAEYVWMILQKLDISGAEKRVIYLSSFLHDIGKISLPWEILNSNVHLDAKDWAQIKLHPGNGHKILWPLLHIERRTVREIVDIVRCHHERVDGRGYPDGLTCEEIPLGARVLALADSYDAMTCLREYREDRGEKSRVVFTPCEAKANLREHPGYDSSLLGLALDVF